MQRRNPFHACHMLLMEMCSRISSTPSGDSQKRPSRDSGKGSLPTVEDRDWGGRVLLARDELGSLKFYFHRLQWQHPQWGGTATWEKAIRNPGFSTAFCVESGERSETWEGTTRRWFPQVFYKGKRSQGKQGSFFKVSSFHLRPIPTVTTGG